jgi:hypothetical protein
MVHDEKTKGLALMEKLRILEENYILGYEIFDFIYCGKV